MQIVIDIPEEVYNSIQDNDYCGISNSDMYNAIVNGIPLPKGHGKLIDADMLWDLYHDNDYDFYEALDDVQTIIEADSEKE